MRKGETSQIYSILKIIAYAVTIVFCRLTLNWMGWTPMGVPHPKYAICDCRRIPSALRSIKKCSVFAAHLMHPSENSPLSLFLALLLSCNFLFPLKKSMVSRTYSTEAMVLPSCAAKFGTKSSHLHRPALFWLLESSPHSNPWGAAPTVEAFLPFILFYGDTVVPSSP